MAFVAYPIFWVFIESFAGEKGTRAPGFVGLDQYLRAFGDPVFWHVLGNMFLWGLITIPVQMLIGGVIAYFIERYTHRSKTFFRVMFFLPVITSVSVVSIVWAQMYAPYYGIVQEYLKYLGIQLNIAPLGEPKMALLALIVVNIWQWTGFSMIMYVAGLNNIPGDIFGAHFFAELGKIRSQDRRRSWIEAGRPHYCSFAVSCHEIAPASRRDWYFANISHRLLDDRWRPRSCQ